MFLYPGASVYRVLCKQIMFYMSISFNNYHFNIHSWKLQGLGISVETLLPIFVRGESQNYKVGKISFAILHKDGRERKKDMGVKGTGKGDR